MDVTKENYKLGQLMDIKTSLILINFFPDGKYFTII